MKKILFGASALALMAGAASAAEPLKLGVAGYYNVYGVYVNQDLDTGLRSSDLKRDGEINLVGSTKLDNGMVVGAQVDLSTFNAISSTNISSGRKSHLFFSGNFGKVVVGEEYAAAYMLQVTAPAVDENFDGFNPKFILVNDGFTAPVVNGYAQNTDKSAKVSYLSPVFSGFQAGVSYTPDQAALTFAGMRADTTEVSSIDLGVKYSGVVSGSGFDVGFGYTKMDNKILGTDPSAWNIGANVGFGAFKVGAAYIKNDADVANADSTAYDLGLTYDMGAYTVGASYFHSKQDTAATTEDKNSRLLVGGSYTYGPGMTFKGSIQHFDLETNTVGDTDNDGWAIVLGTNVNF